MNSRFETIQRKALSAVAALMISTFFIGSAVGPAILATSGSQSVERSVA